MAVKEIVPLSAPVTAHDQEINALELRRPTPQDVREIKHLPYTLGADGGAEPTTDVAMAYLSRLAAVPASTINQLDITDLNQAIWVVVGFFFKPTPETA